MQRLLGLHWKICTSIPPTPWCRLSKHWRYSKHTAGCKGEMVWIWRRTIWPLPGNVDLLMHKDVASLQLFVRSLRISELEEWRSLQCWLPKMYPYWSKLLRSPKIYSCWNILWRRFVSQSWFYYSVTTGPSYAQDTHARDSVLMELFIDNSKVNYIYCAHFHC